MSNNYKYNTSRSKKMIDLINRDNRAELRTEELSEEIPTVESPLPADCNFGDAEWAALEGIIEELSSDKHWDAIESAHQQNSFLKSPALVRPEPVDLNSSERTPNPDPIGHFQIPEENPTKNLHPNISSSCSSFNESLQGAVQGQVTPMNSPKPAAGVNSAATVSECDLPSISNKLLQGPVQGQNSIQVMPINSPRPVAGVDSGVTDSECDSPSTNNELLQGPVQEQNIIQSTPVSSPRQIASVDSLVTVSECDSPSTTNNLNKKRQTTFKSNPGKKRKRCTNEWKDNKRKGLLNAGREYINRKGKVTKEKTLRPPCASTCKLRCSVKFNTETRLNILNNYWQLGDHTKQWEYINKFTKKKVKKRITTEGPSRRNYTVKYFLPLPSAEQSSPYNSDQVCFKTFMNTLCISDQTVRTAHAKLNKEGITESDTRGKHPNHPRVITQDMVKSVCDHVASFQPVESHYTRQNTSKLYLDNNLSMHKMFLLYKEWDQLENYECKAETLRHYTDIVNEHMNIGFFVPKKDLCEKCHSFTNEASPTEDQVKSHSDHIENKNIARQFKQNDKTIAENFPEIVCATFDFQKILNCPHGDVGPLYYKRKLSVYNFTVFDTAEKEGSCYMWTETTGRRGANEVSSCLMLFMQAHVAKGANTFLLWSDNCAGQNRNRVVYSMYMHLSKALNVDITHRFLETGHTQNEGDSVHALVERESKGKFIYTPDQWYALVRWAKTNGKPYNVIEVTQEDIFDYKPFLDERNWKKDMENNNIMWNKIKEIKVEKDSPNCLFFKYDFKGEQHCLNTVVETRRRGKKLNINIELKMAYSCALPITEAKYKDLICLCKSGVIPKEYHSFYKNLKHSANADDQEDLSCD